MRSPLRLKHLPNQFPEGTRYVLEGRAGQIHSRYLEFPDGRHVDLPVEGARRTGEAMKRTFPRRNRRHPVRKFSAA